MFEGYSADTRAGKFPLVSMGGRAEGLACADPGARTPIGASGNFLHLAFINYLKCSFNLDHSSGSQFTNISYALRSYCTPINKTINCEYKSSIITQLI
jgi:hypothetical protein